MANTTNTKSTTTPKTTTKKEAAPATPVVDTEKEQLKAQLAEQQKRMEEMMAQIQVLMQAQSNAVTPTKPVNNRKIKFVNMCTGKLILKGTSLWEIDGQFNDRDFSETEANIIVNNMANAIRSGCVYIADAQYVEEHQLQPIYDNLLSDKQMLDLLNHDYKYVLDMYKTASDAQKKIIVDTIVSKRSNGEYVDANIMIKLGELCGRDLVGITSLDNEE